MVVNEVRSSQFQISQRGRGLGLLALDAGIEERDVSLFSVLGRGHDQMILGTSSRIFWRKYGYSRSDLEAVSVPRDSGR